MHDYKLQKVELIQKHIRTASFILNSVQLKNDADGINNAVCAALTESNYLYPEFIEENFDIKTSYDRSHLVLVYIRNLRNIIDRAELEIEGSLKAHRDLSSFVEEQDSEL